MSVRRSAGSVPSPASWRSPSPASPARILRRCAPRISRWSLIAWFVIVPLAFTSLLTGFIQSLGTNWGLIRHYWVVAKLSLTVLATIVLLLKMEPISYLAGAAGATTLSSAALRGVRIQLIAHAAGGMLVLLAATTLSIFKPWGKTPYGRLAPGKSGP